MSAYDVLILGAGPGGYVAAIRASQLGLRTAIIEREHLGGICLNWGCIPTKALLRTAEIYHYATHAKDYGLTIEGRIGFDAAAIVGRSRGVSARLNAGVGFLMKKNKIDVIWGEGTLTGPGEVRVEASRKPAVEPKSPSRPWRRWLPIQSPLSEAPVPAALPPGSWRSARLSGSGRVDGQPLAARHLLSAGPAR
jgi:dihydrolipoamide dehydrogenase